MLLGAAAPAGAHGEIQGTNPAAAATLRRPPRSVTIVFTEAPTKQGVLTVKDGCGRPVHQGIDFAGERATVRLAIGQPGPWRVEYNVISAVDGHQTRGGYTFTVRGERDCTPDEPTPGPTDPDADVAAPTDDGDGDETGGAGAPVIPIALGAAGVLALALILRRSGSS